MRLKYNKPKVNYKIGGKTIVAQSPDSCSLAEVLDRILDKGLVIDTWARISLVGIDLLTIEARVVVASVDTFLHYAEEITKVEKAAMEEAPKAEISA
ncbi:MAG: gas vesicle structural protein GvpA [Methanosarcina barkeri]|nr:gas vesicle structural protein GvpA [Methanosarcina sp. ERenArc_MAG2]